VEPIENTPPAEFDKIGYRPQAGSRKSVNLTQKRKESEAKYQARPDFIFQPNDENITMAVRARMLRRSHYSLRVFQLKTARFSAQSEGHHHQPMLNLLLRDEFKGERLKGTTIDFSSDKATSALQSQRRSF
jgi:hypothetical protein